MNVIPSLLLYYPLLLVVIVIIYLAGHLLLSPFNIKEVKGSFFLKLLSGYTALISIFAIVYSHFNSIFAPVFFILLVLFIIYKPDVKKVAQNIRAVDRNELGATCIIATIFYSAIYLFWVYDFNRDTLKVIFDFHFYGQLSSFISLTGVETTSFDFYNPSSAQPSIYHYGLSWTTVLFAGLFRQNHLLTMLLVTLPLFFTLLVSGGTALAHALTGKKDYRISIVFLLITGFPLFYPLYSTLNGELGVNLGNEPKAIYLSVFFVAHLLLLLQGKKLLAYSTLVVLSVFYSPLMPIVLPALSLVILYEWFFTATDKKTLLTTLFLVLITGAYTYIFYSRGDAKQTEEFNISSIIQYHVKNTFRAFAGNIIRYSVNIIQSYSPFLILLFVAFRTDKKIFSRIPRVTVIFIALSLAAAITLSSLFINVLDMEQITTKNLQLANMLLAACIIIILYSTKTLRTTSIVLLAVLLVFAPPFFKNAHNAQKLVVNKQPVEALISNMKEHNITQPRIAFIHDTSFYKYIHRYNTLAYIPYKHLNYFFDPLYTTNIDIPTAPPKYNEDFDMNHAILVGLIKERGFYKFTEQQKQANRFTNLDDSRISYIRKNKINYLVWDEQYQLSPAMQSIIDSSMIVLDTFNTHHYTNYYLARIKN